MKNSATGNKNLFICLSGMLLAVMIILGGISMIEKDEDNGAKIMEANQSYMDLMVIHIADDLIELQHAVELLATTSDIARVFTDPSQQDLEKADIIIDNFRTTLDVSVVYLMNETGMTVASTNRDSEDSFVGNNYGFRPYFQDAMSGKPGHYFVHGVTTGTRGYQTSYPVKDPNGTIVGVAVIKQEIDFIGRSFVSEKPFFLVSPEGIIFHTSESNLNAESLWKLDNTTEEALEASREFGPGPFRNLFITEPVKGDEVTLDGEDHIVLREEIVEQGWTIIMLS